MKKFLLSITSRIAVAAWLAVQALAAGPVAAQYVYPAASIYQPEESPSDVDEAGATFEDIVAEDFAASERFWVDGRYYHAWIEGARVPALVTTSPNGTPQGSAGVLPAATVLHGGGRIDENGRPGGGVQLGHWLDDWNGDAFVLEWFSLGDGANTGDFSATSTGDPILARPFFNVDSGLEDAELVAFPGLLDGTVTVITTSELHSAAASLRRNWLSGSRGRIDGLIGYRYLRFRESLAVQENLVSTSSGGFIEQGTRIDVFDRFLAENDFHGLELGISGEQYLDVLTLAWLAKVGLGNVHQELTIDGRTDVTTPGDPTVTSAGGLLALPSNIGTLRDDDFDLLPEVGITGRLALTRNCDFSVGYSLLYLTDIVRAGEHIDRMVDPTQLGNIAGGDRPRARLDDTSMWVQSLFLGLVVRQ